MSEVSPKQFVDSVAALPSTAPRNHAHIVDLNIKYVRKDIMIQDAIVTILYKTSALAMDMFLAATNMFHMAYIPRSNNSDDSLVIMRRGNEVLVGQYTRLQFPVILQFENLIRFSIDVDGAWSITDATYRDYILPSWEDVWAGRTVDFGFSDNNFKTDDSATKEILAMQTADYILSRKFRNDKTFIWTSSRD